MKTLKLFLLALVLLPFGARAELRYVDAATLTIINKAQDDDKPFQRLDVDKYPELTPTVHRYYRYSTGLAIVFRTDSRNIFARWTTETKSNWTNTTLIAQRGLDMYILRDGQWVFAGVATPSADKMEHESKIVESLDGTMHECLLYLPINSEVASLEIGVDEESVLEAVENPFSRKIVVIGSSITHGASASRAGLLYPAQLEREFGLQFANLGASGQCKLDDFYAKIAAETEADAFLFDTFSNPSAELIQERLESFVATVRAAHPDTPLIFLQTEIRETTNFNTKTQKFEADKRAAASEGMRKILSEYKDVYFLDPGIYIGEDHEGTADGTHPNDYGFHLMLNLIKPQLQVIFANYGIVE